MAETIARYGGIGVLPQDMDIDVVRKIVAHIKQAHTTFDTPLTVSPSATLRDVQGEQFEILFCFRSIFFSHSLSFILASQICRAIFDVL